MGFELMLYRHPLKMSQTRLPHVAPQLVIYFHEFFIFINKTTESTKLVTNKM